MKLAFLLFISILISCSNKTLPNNSSIVCSTEAKVLDYTGLDGCRFLLELKNGTKLIPVELEDQNFLFSENQMISIAFTLMNDVVTACMTAALPVHVTCIRELKPGTKPGQEFLIRDCIDTETPLNVSWLNALVVTNRFNEIKKGYFETNPYYVMIRNDHAIVFNCTGAQVCEYELTASSSCKSKFETLSDFKSIWAQK